MKLPTAAEILFSLKCFAASMLALYLALRIGLPRPFWSMTTAYVVASPLAGAVRSKAIFRMSGTILGSIGTILLVPGLANSPELLTLAMACWVGLCLYISLLDRTPRSYVFMLAGYTAALIGFPAVSEPATIFDVGLARVEEIILGITCATVVHSLVLPQSLGPVLLARLDRAIGDARRWVRDALHLESAAQGSRDRRALAGDITELRLMATHLPFDTSHLRWTANAIHALQDRLAMMVPIISAVEDRLRTLHRLDGASLSPRWQQLLGEITEWSQGGEGVTAERAMQLRAVIADITPRIGSEASWSDVLKVNLAARLRALVDVGEDCRTLRNHIDAGLHGAHPPELRRLSALSPRVLHRDHGMAILSASAAVLAIIACSAFWILTAWPAGSAAAMMTAVFCCFFATQDDPVPGIKLFLNYTVLSIPISAIYLLVVLPAVHSFEMLVLATAPVFLALGIFVARPATMGSAMAVVMGVAGMLSLQDTNTLDMVSFINSMLGQIAGMLIAVLINRLFRSVSAEWTARRLLRAGWAELAALAKAARAPSVSEVSARMMDRIALLTPRLAMAGPQQDLSAVDALSDLRAGLNMAQLRRIEARFELEGVSLRPLMDMLSDHFSLRHGEPNQPASALLERLDASLRAVCTSRPGAEQQESVAALVGIRRDLFPDAPAYRALVHEEEKEGR
ncbi:FUSC family protein [Noviherbaspirillum massiliense]|uniref:FUSC family protein n=1 Tax=Noviherbaspirillum massiliense TaxID=1465823 RepID=UPI0003103DFD|nr:FUSC family protein [Noviherbaspirillum massiliense]